jgi:two-component system NtrC family sensor kinase
MRTVLLALLFGFYIQNGLANQNPYWDSPAEEDIPNMTTEFYGSRNDTVKLFLARELGFYYEEINYDSSIFYFNKLQYYSQVLNQELWEAEALTHIGFSSSPLGKFPDALRYHIKAKTLIEEHKDNQSVIGLSHLAEGGNYKVAKNTILGMITNYMGIMYVIMGDKYEAKQHYNEALKIAQEINDPILLSWINMNLSEYYNDTNNPDFALISCRKALKFWEPGTFNTYKGFIFTEIAKAYEHQTLFDSAKVYYQNAIEENRKTKMDAMLAWSYVDYANFLLLLSELDSAHYYAFQGSILFEKINIPNGMAYAYQTLVDFFENRNLDSAFFYLNKAMAAKDSLLNIKKQSTIRSLYVGAEIHQQDLKTKELEYKNQLRINALLGSLLTLIVIAILLYRNNRSKQKAKQKIEEAYSVLKSTQTQLIHSEKMASLGELTAGIAHEIQNPLNFVNNFSEVNRELLEELKAERSKLKGERDENTEDEIIKDVSENQEKINQHGRKASEIVKSMLLHSRTRSGEKELTDINVLCNEYLMLAYHGMRAKNKSFNVEFKTELDPDLPKIKVIPQDIGRVLLNLINNAFQAVFAKAQHERQAGLAETKGEYYPAITVSTKYLDSKIEIRITDNGFGIPEKIRDKIFQPFFTTKPTGQGTGLGLSLSYDIVKAHGGEIKVESKEGEGTGFIFQIPTN